MLGACVFVITPSIGCGSFGKCFNLTIYIIYVKYYIMLLLCPYDVQELLEVSECVGLTEEK